jgi:hypothetical protein
MTMCSSSPSFASFSNGNNTTTTTSVHAASAEKLAPVFLSSIHTGSTIPHHHQQVHAKGTACFGMQETTPAQPKNVHTRLHSHPQTPINLTSYNCARRPALVPHNSSLSLAEASEMISKRIGTPLLPPPDPQRITHLTSYTSAPGSHLTSTGEGLHDNHQSKKRKYSAVSLDGTRGWSCGVHGCGDKTETFHLSMLCDEEGVDGFMGDSPFGCANGISGGWRSARDVSPLSPAPTDAGLNEVEV